MALPPIINRRVAVAMTALCFYGLLLIFIANRNISPSNIFSSFKFRHTLWDVSVENVTEVTHSTTMRLFSNVTIVPGRTTTTIATVNNATNNTNKTISTTRLHTTLKVTSPSPILTTLKSENITKTQESDIKPLITMFTTFRTSPQKEFIHKNTIRNWALLKPYVIPILYHAVDDKSMVPFCAEHGWNYDPIPKVSKHGVPVLRHMFLDAQKKYDTPFYAYTNGDILFDMRFIDTLKVLNSMISKLKKVLIVGRRSNLKLTSGLEIKSLSQMTELAKKAKLFGTNAEDYFISTKHGYPWETIPDFVVGRVGYDNWLVVTGITKGMPVIDTTKTVMALHQTGKDGDFAGHQKKAAGDTYVNYGLAGKRFDYSLGHVTCGQFYSDFENGKITIKERVKNGCEKTYRRYRKNPYIHLPAKRLL